MFSLSRYQLWAAAPRQTGPAARLCNGWAQHGVMGLLVISLLSAYAHWSGFIVAAVLAFALFLQKQMVIQLECLRKAERLVVNNTPQNEPVLNKPRDVIAAQDLLFETFVAQLGFGQSLGDQSVNRLVEDFNQLYVSVTHSMQLAQSAAKRFEPGQDSFAARSELSLAQVLSMLQQALARKTLLLESNQQVAQAASALKHQTEIIQRISKEITLLSLNASIEAARAGEAGRGFSVVAERVRELSDITSQAASDIISRMQTLMQAIAGSSGQLQSSGELDEQLMADANQHIGDVLTGLSQMTHELCGTISQLEQTQNQVQHKLQDAITDFQFQDRVSQRLSHIITALQQLQQIQDVEHTQQLAEIQQIGVSLFQSYTMQDERDLHRAAMPATQLQHSQQDITFF